MGPAVDKGELERQGAVKVIEKGAPPAEDGRLILGGCHGVVDVLVFHGFGVEPAGELAHAVRVHGDIGDGLLGGEFGPCLLAALLRWPRLFVVLAVSAIGTSSFLPVNGA